MGDGSFLSSLGGLGNDVLSAGQALGGDVMSGIQGLGSSIGGLFGGGGAVSPGTIGATAAQAANVAPLDTAAMGPAIAGAVPSAASTAAGFAAAPGLDVASTGGGLMGGPNLGGDIADAIPGGVPGVTAGGGALNTALASSAMNPQAINPQGPITLQPGVDASPAGLKTGGNFLQSLLSNPKLLGAGGTALATILANSNQPAALKQLQQMEQQEAGFAKNQGELATAEQQGLLPAGATNMFQGQLQAAEAAIRSKYAEMGMTGSSAEMQDLDAARTSIMGQMFQQGQTMAAQGFGNMQSATGVQSELLSQILQQEVNQKTALGQALGKFAAAFTDATPPTTGT